MKHYLRKSLLYFDEVHRYYDMHQVVGYVLAKVKSVLFDKSSNYELF